MLQTMIVCILPYPLWNFGGASSHLILCETINPISDGELSQAGAWVIIGFHTYYLLMLRAEECKDEASQ